MPSRNYILDGHTPVPCDNMRAWAQWIGTANRVVRKDSPCPGVVVSTVFLGMDHQFGEGSPLLFETMVFRSGDGQEQDRCATWEKAEAMHARMVAEVCRTEGIPDHSLSALIKPQRKDTRPTVWQHLLDDED